MSKGSYRIDYDRVRAIVRAKYANWIAIYSEIESLVREKQRHEQFHLEDLQQKLVMALFGRTLSNTSAAMFLAEHGYEVQCKIVQRTALEALFSLVAIAGDSKIAEAFAQAQERELKRRVFKSKLWSKELRSTVESRLNSDTFRKVEDLAKSTKAKNISTEEMAKAAGLHDWYLTAYTVYSASVHANIIDLEEQYVLSEDGSEIVGMRSGAIVDNLHGLYLNASEILLKGLEVMETVFQVETKEFRSHMLKRLVDAMAEHNG
jgi:hypothetical protein